MISYVDFLADNIIKFLDYLDNVLINKPLISVAFPTTGLLSMFIPNDIVSATSTPNIFIEFIDGATPYLKFLFLILTLMLSIVSFILQMKKLFNKDKVKIKENE